MGNCCSEEPEPELSDNGDINYQNGMKYLNTYKYEIASKYFRKGAEQRHPECFKGLAYTYYWNPWEKKYLMDKRNGISLYQEYNNKLNSSIFIDAYYASLVRDIMHDVEIHKNYMMKNNYTKYAIQCFEGYLTLKGRNATDYNDIILILADCYKEINVIKRYEYLREAYNSGRTHVLAEICATLSDKTMFDHKLDEILNFFLIAVKQDLPHSAYGLALVYESRGEWKKSKEYCIIAEKSYQTTMLHEQMVLQSDSDDMDSYNKTIKLNNFLSSVENVKKCHQLLLRLVETNIGEN
ncbi:MAG: hypothetical protein Edafosvirus1_72 [Edafosvirus sp.]|uniref:Tetratricopeptide repeat protein n=1 Tax=Edafosvirus sp. TaxID=2487765 RepID=A0A3G4ZUR4_9VIRU|nr:MAG: hypothetical protein Edafosvirus1_72 [Edafosvirus sp.]